MELLDAEEDETTAGHLIPTLPDFSYDYAPLSHTDLSPKYSFPLPSFISSSPGKTNMSKTYAGSTVSALPSESSTLLDQSTGGSTSTNPFRRNNATANSGDAHTRQASSQHYTGSSSASKPPPPYRSARPSDDIRKEAFSEISAPERRSLDSYRNAPSTKPSEHRRRSSSLRERYPGDPSVHPLDRITRDAKRANRAPHLRKHHQPHPDLIDVLDETGVSYHHEGPFDAALLVRNSSYNSSPVAALKNSNAEALRATPREKIDDSLKEHRPLDGTAVVPPGQKDAFGRSYDYVEGADLMHEPGADYKRWPGVKYLPEDLKGKGEPSYSIEKSLKEHSGDKYGAEGDSFELVDRTRDSQGAAKTTGSSHGADHSRARNLSGEIKRKLGSFRRKER